MQNERWGKRKPDNRNWHEYNEKLVRRYSFFAPLDMVKNWDDELALMNEQKEGKAGRRFIFPNGLIKMLAYFQNTFHLPVRGVEGLAQDFEKLGLIKKAPDYSQYSRRLNALDWKPAEEVEDVPENAVIANDSTGIKVTSFGEWRHVVHKRKRTGFLKITIIVDTKTKQILGIEVTPDTTHEMTLAPQLVEEALEITSVSEYHGDGAFDSYEWFDRLDYAGIKPVIPPRLNSNPYIYPDSVRSKIVIEYQKDPKTWRKKNNAGIRWMSETAFSIWKTIFGEHCRAKKFPNQIKEMIIKACVYNMLRNN